MNENDEKLRNIQSTMRLQSIMDKIAITGSNTKDIQNGLVISEFNIQKREAYGSTQSISELVTTVNVG